MKTYTHFLLLLLTWCFSCKAPLDATSNVSAVYKVTAEVADSVSSIEKLLKPYRDSLDKSMNEVIGYAEGDFVKEKPGGSLGSLVVDAMFEQAKKINERTSNAICNYGGIRIPEIKSGNITIGKVFELLPFENELVILEITGEDLEKWVKLMDNSGGWPMRKYIKLLEYNNKFYFNDTTYRKNATEQRVTAVNFKRDSIYIFATNDYIANGGDNCDFLKTCKKTNTGILIRDIVIEYIKAKKTIHSDIYKYRWFEN